MSEEPENIVIEHLRGIRRSVDLTRDDVQELKQRMTNVERSLLVMTERVDRIEIRLDKIEKRLDLVPAS